VLHAAVPAVQQRHPRLVYVEAEDGKAGADRGERERQADIAKPDDADRVIARLDALEDVGGPGGFEDDGFDPFHIEYLHTRAPRGIAAALIPASAESSHAP
jgi:hypothetical protein